MKKLLITGFEPFGGDKINPALEALRLLPEVIGNCELDRMELPVVFQEAADRVIRRIRESRPDAVLLVGLAAGRTGITVERIGVNLRVARIPDNAGNVPDHEPIRPEGPDGLFVTVPVMKLVNGLTEAGIPAKESFSAGAYVCNDVLYSVLYETRAAGIPAGFIHVPLIREQAKENEPFMELSEIVRGLKTIVDLLV